MSNTKKSAITFLLNHNIIAQILGNNSFYAEVPSYYFMRKMGLETVKKWRSYMLGEDTGDLPCVDCNDRTLLKPAITAFINLTLDLHKNDEELLIPLKEYIEKQLGKPIKKVVLHYKGSHGAVETLEF